MAPIRELMIRSDPFVLSVDSHMLSAAGSFGSASIGPASDNYAYMSFSRRMARADGVSARAPFAGGCVRAGLPPLVAMASGHW